MREVADQGYFVDKNRLLKVVFLVVQFLFIPRGIFTLQIVADGKFYPFDLSVESVMAGAAESDDVLLDP